MESLQSEAHAEAMSEAKLAIILESAMPNVRLFSHIAH